MPLLTTTANASSMGAILGSSSVSTKWVAVGSYAGFATIVTTPDDPTSGTATWTSQTHTFGTTEIIGVASSGSRLIAVGASGKLATSDDGGVTWTARTSSFSTSNIYSISYGNGEWIAIGASKMAYSTDNGNTWTQFTVSGFSAPSFMGAGARYANGYWVIGGGSGDIIYATSAAGTWTRVLYTTTTMTSADDCNVSYNSSAGLWVLAAEASGLTGSIATASAPNGTWTSRSLNATAGGLRNVLASSSTTSILVTETV